MFINRNENPTTHLHLRAALQASNTKRLTLAADTIETKTERTTTIIDGRHGIQPGIYKGANRSRGIIELVHLGMGTPGTIETPTGPDWQVCQIPHIGADPEPLCYALTGLIGDKPPHQHVRAITTARRGRTVTIIYKTAHAVLICDGVTIEIHPLSPRVPTTRVLITGMPVQWHRAIKERAALHGTSANRLILDTLTREFDK